MPTCKCIIVTLDVAFILFIPQLSSPGGIFVRFMDESLGICFVMVVIHYNVAPYISGIDECVGGPHWSVCW